MSFLSAELLAAIHKRAARHDRDNSFPEDDLNDLRTAGYLSAFVPKEFNGAGLSVERICAEQTALAKAAPATALAINMHQIIVGMARYLVAHGNEKGRQVLHDAAAGELFGFGISEPGNDLVLFGSISKAVPDGEGGFSFHGTKVFTSLAPAWTRLLTFGTDDSGDDGPHSVFAILHRDDGGFYVKPDWDTLGMRATQSNTTVLDGAHAPADQVLARITPGPNADPVVFGIFSHFSAFIAATYQGIGERAIEVAAEQVATRHSVKNDDVYAHDPDIRWRLADAAIAMNGSAAQLRDIVRDLDDDADRGALWMPQLSAVKNACVEATMHAVDQAMRSVGGRSYYTSNELSRLYRDAVAGLFQPTDQESLHAAWANVVLGPITKG
ncbi:Acyl-CoA dehydrogenase type 2 domain protein [Propionibacterium freudenreichii]|uniref:acyl-CoA dehydrogenase family protein n=1 Tax=Propionibacterium freudenreichii TaxID=1744 RepID=UPI000BC2E320|nr:acyl-CoA dehydrogenase family protein [Propionibacterium freudenreichii]SBN60732.1 Acyl-CoA dehydrogenase type 2 domain protein [Propionibacterium freudenreichii]SCQ49603.1 Acyl-CoA dehydrogenase type 2 domain protein [Propionibacterium freudenreichii]SCQ55074.1 Acyl-CoA dehydrogenase type 2 domain protein [Propionibacterium freudenreichii]